MGVIVYNGLSSDDFGIVVEHYPNYEFPERDYESVEIPGKNGTLLMDKHRYKNGKSSYDLAVADPETNLPVLANRLVNWLHSATGYAKLSDSYEPLYYRLACFKDSGSISNIVNHGGRATIAFDCKPQRFLVSGDTPITNISSGSTITNPEMYPSKPLIKVIGRGPGILNVNDYVTHIKNTELSLGNSTGVEFAEIDADKFMQKIGTSTATQFVFDADSIELEGDITKAYGISAIDIDEDEFIEATDCDQEGKYNFIFVKADANVSEVYTATLEEVGLTDKATFMTTFSDEGVYTFSYSGATSSFEVSGTGITAVSVNSETYLNRFIEIGDPQGAFVDRTYTYMEGGYWFDGTYSIEPTDYGMTITGDPVEGDTITGRLKANWTRESTDYIDIFTFAGFPLEGDTVSVVVTSNSWAYWKDTAVIVESGFDISDYGITLTGTPLNGDLVVVKAGMIWKLGSSEVTLSQYGISYSGEAKVGDSITVGLERPLFIDCEIMDCYSNTTNRNLEVSFEKGFPELSPGSNLISFTGGITSVEVTPRWWTL